MLSSPVLDVHYWEIWVFAKPDFSEPVQECGSFRASEHSWRATVAEAERGAEDEAVRMASRLRNWLHLGVWSDHLHPDLYQAREGLRALGIDPARVMVSACKREPGDHDNEVRPPLAGHWGDGGALDTVLEPVGVSCAAEDIN